MSNPSNPIYQIKVSLNHIRPPIWRRFLVAGDTTLSDLHDILQIVMGWENSHLHDFIIDEMIYHNSEDLEFAFNEDEFPSESHTTLSAVIKREKQRFTYRYDFGDSWEHTLVVEKILPPQQDFRYPICLKGARACPPEDVGGVWGYQYFLDAISDPDHPEHEDYLEWIGGEFDPEAFDLNSVNNLLRRVYNLKILDGRLPIFTDEDDLLKIKYDLDSAWSKTLPEEQRRIAEELPLRRDVVVLLTYLRDNKVSGTKTTGNFPLKAVREICAQMVNPPPMEENIAGLITRVRSESDVQPLVFRHILAATGGLISGGPGQRWKLTPLGERFLAADAAAQVFFLTVTWWTRTNWAVASRAASQFGYLSFGFSKTVLKELLQMPVAEPLPFKPFAGRLLGVSAPLSDISAIQELEILDLLFYRLIQSVVIVPLAHFGILHTDMDLSMQDRFKILSVESFQITPFGRGLLQAVHDLIEAGQQ